MQRQIGAKHRGKGIQDATAHDLLEDVSSAESERWSTRVDVAPVVVGVRNVQMTSVFGTVGVGVADKRGLILYRHNCISMLQIFQVVHSEAYSSLYGAKGNKILTWS